MSEWGRCLNCGCTSKEPYCQNCDGDLEGKCNECGCAFEDDMDACLDHIDEYEDLEKYARGLVECRDKLIGENRELREDKAILTKMVESGDSNYMKLVEECRSLNAKVDGGVETVKEQNSLIAALKSAVKELQDVINKQIDHANRLTADSLGITKETK